MKYFYERQWWLDEKNEGEFGECRQGYVERLS
jgi:hypothetical protein